MAKLLGFFGPELLFPAVLAGASLLASHSAQAETATNPANPPQVPPQFPPLTTPPRAPAQTESGAVSSRLNLLVSRDLPTLDADWALAVTYSANAYEADATHTPFRVHFATSSTPSGPLLGGELVSLTTQPSEANRPLDLGFSLQFDLAGDSNADGVIDHRDVATPHGAIELSPDAFVTPPTFVGR
ncbi:MAG: hypothetical protein AAGF31_13840 [Planctomycetota bacterium]